MLEETRRKEAAAAAEEKQALLSTSDRVRAQLTSRVDELMREIEELRTAHKESSKEVLTLTQERDALVRMLQARINTARSTYY